MATGGFSFAVAVSPDGESVYVTNYGSVSQYEASYITGAMIPVDSGSIRAI